MYADKMRIYNIYSKLNLTVIKKVRIPPTKVEKLLKEVIREAHEVIQGHLEDLEADREQVQE